MIEVWFMVVMVSFSDGDMMATIPVRHRYGSEAKCVQAATIKEPQYQAKVDQKSINVTGKVTIICAQAF
jgi:hypothetical protein